MEQETLLKPYLDKYDNAVKGQNPEEYIKSREEYIKYQAEFDKNVGHYYETAKNPTWDEAISLFGEISIRDLWDQEMRQDLTDFTIRFLRG